jgi:hypothetical protein
MLATGVSREAGAASARPGRAAWRTVTRRLAAGARRTRHASPIAEGPRRVGGTATYRRPVRTEAALGRSARYRVVAAFRRAVRGRP